MDLVEFNTAPRARVETLLLQCVDVPRWAGELAEMRPFAARADLIQAAASVAGPFSPDEIEQALSHHPRIGEQARGETAEAAFSRKEQSLVAGDATVAEALRKGNAAYEAQFGRVFLIRAAGRGAEEILDQLQKRLGNSPDVEDVVVSHELKEIAALRLGQLIEDMG